MNEDIFPQNFKERWLCLLLFLVRHFLVEFEETLQSGFVRGEWSARIARLHDAVQPLVSSLQVSRHGIGIE